MIRKAEHSFYKTSRIAYKGGDHFCGAFPATLRSIEIGDGQALTTIFWRSNMKKIIVLALSLAVSSLGFSASKECDDVNNTYDICESFSGLETSANKLAAKLAEAGDANAAMWTVSILESGKWAFDAAVQGYRDQVKEALTGVKDRYYKAKEASEDARSKNDSIQKEFWTYQYYSRELVTNLRDWLDESDDDADDFDDDNESDDDNDSDDLDDFDDDNESDDIDDLDDL